MRRFAVFATLAVAFVATMLGTIPGSSGATIPDPGKAPTACYMPGSPQLAKVRANIAKAVASGQMSKAVGADTTCDPRLLATKYLTYTVTQSPAPAQTITPAYATRCKGSTTWNYTWSSGGVVTGGLRVNLYWCYNGSTVTAYSGQCVGYLTTWGNINGWSGGCDVNQFIMYTLNGHGNGGVHHVTQGHWRAATGFPGLNFTSSARMDMWGHYDGSCDTKYNSTLRHYC